MNEKAESCSCAREVKWAQCEGQREGESVMSYPPANSRDQPLLTDYRCGIIYPTFPICSECTRQFVAHFLLPPHLACSRFIKFEIHQGTTFCTFSMLVHCPVMYEVQATKKALWVPLWYGTLRHGNSKSIQLINTLYSTVQIQQGAQNGFSVTFCY